jgi:hypothetical protein
MIKPNHVRKKMKEMKTKYMHWWLERAGKAGSVRG